MVNSLYKHASRTRIIFTKNAYSYHTPYKINEHAYNEANSHGNQPPGTQILVLMS